MQSGWLFVMSCYVVLGTITSDAGSIIGLIQLFGLVWLVSFHRARCSMCRGIYEENEVIIVIPYTPVSITVVVLTIF